MTVLARLGRRPRVAVTEASSFGGPVAALDEVGLTVAGRPLAGFEFAPINLELFDSGERDAALEALAALYDAIPRPFQLLSVPAERDPGEHLIQIEERLPTRAAERLFRAYAALYRELSAEPKRPLRRTYLLVDATSPVELRRISELISRVAQERGIVLRAVDTNHLGDVWRTAARTDATYRVGATDIDGPTVLSALSLSQRWPAEVEPGWLARLASAPGVTAASVRVRPVGRAEAMRFLTTRLREVTAGERLAAERGEIGDVERERLGETALTGRRRIAGGESRLSFVDVVLLIEAPDRAALAERIQALRLDARGAGFELDIPTLRLADAWSSIVPGPAPSPIAERNVDTGSLAASLLHVASDLYEPSGQLVGRVRGSAAPIVLDRFAHPSHNAIVLGQTGTGKTMFTGAEIARSVLRGIRVLGVDPLGDYRRLVDALGGTYVALGGPSGGLNPFALTGTRTAGAFAAKLAVLERLVAAMAGGLSRDERPALDRALRATYGGAGIGPDPATHERPVPVLADLVGRLGDEVGGVTLGHRLERWATGSLAEVFRAEGPLPLDRGLLVIGLADLSDPEVRSVAQLAALAVLWDAVRADLSPKLVVVDEAWKVMRQPAGAEFIEELARSARHYHAGLQLATQDIVEFLRSDFGEAIVKQCDVRVLLGQTPEGADALARYFDLTEAERRLLLHARPGEGLLFVGRSHVAFEAVVSRREYALLTTRPTDLMEQATLRYDAPDSG